jgi:hypothetical protein
MTFEDIMKYVGNGIVLHSVELIEEENEAEGATEDEIELRIEAMDHDEMIQGVACGFLLMREHPETNELEEADFEHGADDLFDEIHEYLKYQDLDAPDGEDSD